MKRSLLDALFIKSRSLGALLLLPLLFVLSCSEDREADISEVEIETEIRRFDQALYGTDTARSSFQTQLQSLKSEFPYFFMSRETDDFFYRQRMDPEAVELYLAVKEKLGDMETIEADLNRAFKHYYYYFGQRTTYEVFSYISRLDYAYPVLLSDSMLFIASDMYLGVNSPFYADQPDYLAFFRQADFMVRDAMEALIQGWVAPPKEDRLLDHMLYHGKQLYAISQLMPGFSEANIMRYSPEHIEFCHKNEKSIWAYFVENQLLFDPSADVKRRFIDLAPFSKFRTNFDSESPGMIGRWVGYRIVKAYAEQIDHRKLPEVLAEPDADKILKLSGYKP